VLLDDGESLNSDSSAWYAYYNRLSFMVKIYSLLNDVWCLYDLQ
jgi:hypothetical protein